MEKKEIEAEELQKVAVTLQEINDFCESFSEYPDRIQALAIRVKEHANLIVNDLTYLWDQDLVYRLNAMQNRVEKFQSQTREHIRALAPKKHGVKKTNHQYDLEKTIDRMKRSIDLLMTAIKQLVRAKMYAELKKESIDKI